MDATKYYPQTTEPVIERAGWSIEQFAQAAGLSRSRIYLFPESEAPRSVKIGRRRVYVESPKAWLERLAAAQRDAQP
jgi:predicted DNA-binding transcriptional regulator AlpA